LIKVLEEAEALLTADEKEKWKKRYLELIRNLKGLAALKSLKECIQSLS
jgi:hypothetical protein